MTETWPTMLSQRSAHLDATGDLHFDPSAVPGTATLTPLLREASILVRGEDAESFLQGQLSNDIRQVSAAQGQLAAYCTPKGRVLATFSVWPHDRGYVLRLPADLAGPIRKRLQMYILRSRVVLEDVSGDVALLGLTGPESVPLFREQIGAPPDVPFEVVGRGGLTAMALPGERIQIALPASEAAALWDRLIAGGCAPAGQDAWDCAGIAAGVVTVLSATSDQFIPQMLNLELAGAVAFDKGCYPGQEIVARSQYRGTVKRRLHRFASLQSTHAGVAMVAADGSVAGMVVNAARTRNGGYELLGVVSQDGAEGPLRLSQEAPALQPLPLPYALPTAARAGADGD